MQIWLTIAAIIALLLISAFFSGSETALTAASRARMHQLEKEGDKNAARVNRLTEMREKLIGAILLGNNLVNILASALTTSLFMQLFGAAGVLYATLMMTALVVIFAEVLPKTYALARPDRAALRAAPLLDGLMNILGPPAGAIERIVAFALGLIGVRMEESEELVDAHDELRGAIALHHSEGAVVKHDRDMLDGILDLGDLDIKDVMVHRTKMETINADEPSARIIRQVLKSPYTRLPVWRGEPENIIGILHARDMVRAMARRNGEEDNIAIDEMISEPWFVPETTSLKDQLAAFLREKKHVALVVDEYGEVQGLVTLEDIIEEIVGEIVDEHDVKNTAVRPQKDGSINVDGLVPIRDLNRQFDWNLPEDEATTIAGLVIHKAQAIPEPGQQFTFEGFRFEVLRRKRNQITALRITPLPRTRRKSAQ